jgi:hypothetical protein
MNSDTMNLLRETAYHHHVGQSSGLTKLYIMGGDSTSSIKPELTAYNIYIFGPSNKAFKDHTITSDNHLQDPVVH